MVTVTHLPSEQPKSPGVLPVDLHTEHLCPLKLSLHIHLPVF